MITWDDVVAIAPSLSAVSAEGQAIILDFVELQVTEGQWGVDRARLGRIFLAAHLGSLAITTATAAGPIASETVGPLSRTYMAAAASAGATGATSWGKQYQAMRMALPARFGLTALGCW